MSVLTSSFWRLHCSDAGGSLCSRTYSPVLSGRSDTVFTTDSHALRGIKNIIFLLLSQISVSLKQLPDVQAGLEKAEEPEIKLPISVGS